MKFKILETTSSDAGSYSGMKNIAYGQIVEGVYCDAKQNSIYVKGDEFIRIGGDPSTFDPSRLYMYGDFEGV
jgi:hypothetical protein